MRRSLLRPRSHPNIHARPRPPAGTRPRRAIGAVLLIVAAGCAVVRVPIAPSGVVEPLPDAPNSPTSPAPPASPAGIACRGPLSSDAPGGRGTPGRVRLVADGPLHATLGAPAALGLELLGEGQRCGGRIVLARADDPTSRTLAATTAILTGAPLLLLPGPALVPTTLPTVTRTVLERRLDENGLDTRDVVSASTPEEQLQVLLDLHTQGVARPDGPPTVVLVAATDDAMQAEVVAQVDDGVWPLVVDVSRATPDGPPSGSELGALTMMLDATAPEVRLRWAASDATVEAALLALGVDAFALERWAPDDVRGAAELWLGDVDVPGLALTAAVVAAARDAAFVAVDGADLRAGVARTARIRTLVAALPEPATVVLVGGGADADWQLDTVLEGTPLPGGGFLPLEDRRVVALYGSPGAPSLGLLGQQDLEATIDRVREFAAGYEDAADGRIVVPGFDIIATVASAGPEPTGDYSRRIPIELLRPLVDRAGEEGMAVILDLQPGRTDFLTQAKEYEELLLLPHVHLALDPEWRIGPTERHLQRIGSVEAAEVQEVADWLAALVRRELLPQKILMLHQFVLPMLGDRDTVVVPPELVGVVHVDGQGPLPTKDRTYAVMTDGAEERWAWGWKNFTLIDVPMATPERTLDRTPVPVIVTYQ